MSSTPRLVLISLASLLVAACSTTEPALDAEDRDSGSADTGHDQNDMHDAGSDAVATQGYAVEYIASAAGLHVGKSTFQLKIVKADGTPATDLAASIKIAPTMKMSPMMSHGNPVPVDAVTESSTPGTYDCTLFFTMASEDMAGKSQGEWTLKVDIGAFDAGTIELRVKPAMGTDTANVMLRNSGDMIASMGGAKMRGYAMFRDTLEAAGESYVFTTFLATMQEGGAVWPPVTVGLKLMDMAGSIEQLTVQSVQLEASSDGNTWVPMPCDALSRCSAAVAGLAKGAPATIHVKMKLNDEDYTTDGNALDPSKNAAAFAVTPP